MPGRVSQGVKLGQLSLSDVTTVIRNWWSQVAPQVKSPVGGSASQIFPTDSTFVTSYEDDKKAVPMTPAGGGWGNVVKPKTPQGRLFPTIPADWMDESND